MPQSIGSSKNPIELECEREEKETPRIPERRNDFDLIRDFVIDRIRYRGHGFLRGLGDLHCLDDGTRGASRVPCLPVNYCLLAMIPREGLSVSWVL